MIIIKKIIKVTIILLRNKHVKNATNENYTFKQKFDLYIKLMSEITLLYLSNLEF